VLLAEPARHKGGFDKEPENSFRRCGNEDFALDIEHPVHRRLGLDTVRSATCFNRKPIIPERCKLSL